MNSSSFHSLFEGGRNSPPPSRRSRASQRIPWLLLGGLIAGFGFVGWLLFGGTLRPAKEVRLENVVTTRAGSDVGQQRSLGERETDPWSAPAIFQASGWVEADPLPVKATALVSGVVDSVSVLEGEAVAQGDLLATLIREDFELDLATAKSDLAAGKAQAEAHEAGIREVEAQMRTLALSVRAGEMKIRELEDRRDRLVAAGPGAVAEGERRNAELALQTMQGEVEAREAARDELLSRKSRLEAMREEFAALVRRAEVEVKRKELALARTEIRAPVDGIVLRLLAVPGQKRMLEMDEPDSATVAILYQPEFLQARIDVPLEEAAQLGLGQAVRLRSSFLSERVFQGVVTRIAGEADLQRNTLQAKVRVMDPDIRLRPDMLCRAEFLSSSAIGEEIGGQESGNGDRTPSSGEADRVFLYVAEAALLERREGSARVWALDASGTRIESREITLGPGGREGYARVLAGLRPGDRVVVHPDPGLESGDLVKSAALP